MKIHELLHRYPIKIVFVPTVGRLSQTNPICYADRYYSQIMAITIEMWTVARFCFASNCNNSILIRFLSLGFAVFCCCRNEMRYNRMQWSARVWRKLSAHSHLYRAQPTNANHRHRHRNRQRNMFGVNFSALNTFHDNVVCFSIFLSFHLLFSIVQKESWATVVVAAAVTTTRKSHPVNC